MIEPDLSPIHALPSGLCEDVSGEATALITRMSRADAAALAELHALWSPLLLGIACRMLGDRRAAEKAVRDAFVRFWRRAAEFDPHKSPPFVWAFAILRELCMNRLPSRQHSRKPSPDREPPTPHTLPPDQENHRVMPPDDWRRVRRALDALPPEERSCLESAVFLGHTPKTSPEPSETPPGTVKHRLRRALDALRNDLSRYEL